VTLPAYSTDGGGVSGLGTATLSPFFPAGVSAGDILILHVGHTLNATQGAATYAFPTTRFELMFLSTKNSIRQWTYIRSADGSETTSTLVNITVTSGTTAARHSAVIYRLTNATTVWTSSSITASTIVQVNDSDVTTIGSSYIAVNAILQTQGRDVVSFTGESGGDWIRVFNMQSTPALSLQIADMASSGTVGGGVSTLDGVSQSIAAGFALITNTPAAGGWRSILDSPVFVGII